MALLGIIGGIAPESTIAYYRQLVAAFLAEKGDGNYPSMLINSINMKRMLDLVAAREFDALVAFLLNEVEKLARAGADFALLASNTPHIVFPSLAARSPLPMLSIVESLADHARERGIGRLGLFGTKFTMQGGFYEKALASQGVELTLPEPDMQDVIHDIYMRELVRGIFRDTSRAELMRIVMEMRERSGIEALVLGGTELPLLLRPQDEAGLPFLDTTAIHVQAALAKML